MARKKDRLRAAAILAVLLEEAKGQALQATEGRDGGAAWSHDHRRSLIGRRNLFRARTRRSTTR
ncbi:MAG: hypothetical protein MK169_05215 [Candidatus Thalassarchaeum sp.]|nr:hypothetical protein [Candidatus Thalassarchaeum sp.]MCS5532008.1 hypothetical protein [Candidatus Poseidoniales archaeon]MEC8939191.1 hypothetical protein [Candidatus Thermoplasmatota archaeon]MEC9351338.1 hypothetical protein [Candidatus Thermoplasmatota archaeon]MEC9393827.1 hypothetical protein [Candidatus Thermoplasmatota archaeon]